MQNDYIMPQELTNKRLRVKKKVFGRSEGHIKLKKINRLSQHGHTYF